MKVERVSLLEWPRHRMKDLTRDDDEPEPAAPPTNFADFTIVSRFNKMRQCLAFLTLLAASLSGLASASVFLPYNMKKTSLVSTHLKYRKDISHTTRKLHQTTAMAIPGNGVAEQVLVGGFGNFLSIYNLVVTARILLSWFPQAQGVGALQPVYAITDPFLNLFRGVIPPIFGLDLSPIAAFFLLNVLTNATAAVGCEIPPHLQTPYKRRSRFGRAATRGAYMLK